LVGALLLRRHQLFRPLYFYLKKDGLRILTQHFFKQFG
jgi:hypothetical protein